MWHSITGGRVCSSKVQVLQLYLHHEFGGVRFGVAEQFLEYVGHIRHQIDRVVPHDRDPGTVRGGVFTAVDISRPAGVGECA